MNEAAAEKVAVGNTGKEHLLGSIANLLNRGYAISNAEVGQLADAYEVQRASAAGLLITKKADRIMAEAGVVAVRRDYKGWKIWVDRDGKTKPEEIRRTEKILDTYRSNRPKKGKARANV